MNRKKREIQQRHQHSPAMERERERKAAIEHAIEQYEADKLVRDRTAAEMHARRVRWPKLLEAVHKAEHKYGSITLTPIDSAEIREIHELIGVEAEPDGPAVTETQRTYYRVYKSMPNQRVAAKALGIGRQILQDAIVAVESNGGLGK